MFNHKPRFQKSENKGLHRIKRNMENSVINSLLKF